MKILLASTKFTHLDGSPWLVSELASELLRRGQSVTVLNVEWSGKKIIPSREIVEAGVEFISIPAVRSPSGKVGLIFRWFFSSWKTWIFFGRCLLRGDKYDLFIGFSPCTSLYATLPFAHALSHRSCLIYWDFFPIHNQEIAKKVPSMGLPFLKVVERFLVGKFSRVGCMSQKGVDFFSTYFDVPSPLPEIIPIWTSLLDLEDINDREEERRRIGASSDAVCFVFGGQITAGRGVLELCRAAILARQKTKKTTLWICGDGSLVGEVKDLARENPDAIRYCGQLPRVSYLKLLALADVGVVITAGDVSSPSFPSKSLDYMAAELPILAAVEPATDFGEIIEKNKIGRACDVRDFSSLVDLIIEMTLNDFGRDLEKTRIRNYLRKNHSVGNVANLILGDIDA